MTIAFIPPPPPPPPRLCHLGPMSHVKPMGRPIDFLNRQADAYRHSTRGILKWGPLTGGSLPKQHSIWAPVGPQSGPSGAHLGPNFAQLGPNRGPNGMLLGYVPCRFKEMAILHVFVAYLCPCLMSNDNVACHYLFLSPVASH